MKSAIMSLFLALCAFSLYAGEAPAQGQEADTVRNDPRRQAADRVMLSLSESETNQTIGELLRPYWPFTGETAAKGRQLGMDIRNATSQMEATIGRQLPGRYEFLGTKTLGTTFATFYYVQKYEHAGLLYAYSFYNGKSGWMLNSATWTADPKADRSLWVKESRLPSGELVLVKQAVDRAMTALSGGQTNAVFGDLFKKYWPVRNAAADQAEDFATLVLTSTKNLEANLGRRMQGQFEFLGSKRLGNTYALFVYALKHESGTVPAAFLFYQSPGGWLLNDATFAEGAQADMVSMNNFDIGR